MISPSSSESDANRLSDSFKFGLGSGTGSRIGPSTEDLLIKESNDEMLDSNNVWSGEEGSRISCYEELGKKSPWMIKSVHKFKGICELGD